MVGRDSVWYQKVNKWEPSSQLSSGGAGVLYWRRRALTTPRKSLPVDQEALQFRREEEESVRQQAEGECVKGHALAAAAGHFPLNVGSKAAQVTGVLGHNTAAVAPRRNDDIP